MARGVKDLVTRRVRDVLALEHLPEGGIIRHADDFPIEFEGEVEIANQPAEARPGRGSGEGNLEHGLRLLGDEVGRAGGAEERGGIVERLFEVEPKLTPVRGDAAPSALGERVAIHRKENFREAGRGLGEWGADDFH